MWIVFKDKEKDWNSTQNVYSKMPEYGTLTGQLHTAALELIHLLVQSGSRIIYSGDLDPEGMIIADKLWQKYP